jgi:hypothetical protein
MHESKMDEKREYSRLIQMCREKRPLEDEPVSIKSEVIESRGSILLHSVHQPAPSAKCSKAKKEEKSTGMLSPHRHANPEIDNSEPAKPDVYEFPQASDVDKMVQPPTLSVRFHGQ